jgi:putative ABC transport system ATP-binding protein
MIRCLDVHKAYRRRDRRTPALRGASLEIDRPGFVAVMGPSGSGKSTLLHLLAALDRPDAGEVWVSGERIDELDDAQLTRFRRRGVGVVFQQFNLIPTMTARENVKLPGVLAGERERDLDARADELLEALGVLPRADHKPDALSGGEQQRVAIARALLFEPRVLLADEPTGALDSASSGALWRLLGEIARGRDMTILMVTHEPAAAAHCREVFVLADGVVADHFDSGDLDAAGVATRYQHAGG